MDIAITKMSSKGQVVIPSDIRGDLHEGDSLIIIRNQDQIIMKQANKLDRNFKDDMKFARKTEEAWKRVKAGKGIKMDFDDFMDEMKKW